MKNYAKSSRMMVAAIGVSLLLCGFRVFGQNADHKPVTVIIFDVCGAASTFSMGLNDDGVVTGYYTDNVGSGIHGFLSHVNGAIGTFDVPGATSETAPNAINSKGVVVGTYCDATNCHGFLRAPDGSITPFDVPGADGTLPAGLNDEGVLIGTCIDNVGSGFPSFVRTRNGVFTKFDPSMVNNLSGIINDTGMITGYFFDVNPMVRNFVPDRKGNVTIFDAPNVCTNI